MIICDKHKFVFIHIPKCAGSFLKMHLCKFDDAKGVFSGKVGTHQEIGQIDLAHIPLNILRKYFFYEYKKVCLYLSFAVVRDPFLRFPSSLSQRLKAYKNVPIQKLRSRDIRKAVDDVIDFLTKNSDIELLPLPYIHFQRQVDYIFDRKERMVDRVYTIEKVEKLLQDIGEISGSLYKKLSGENRNRKNSSVLYRNSITRIIVEKYRPFLKPIINKCLNDKSKAKLKDLIYVPSQKRLSNIFESYYVKDFINHYYSKDLDFIKSLKTRSSGASKD